MGVLAALVFLGLQFPVGGRPIKDHALDFYHAPIVREAIRQGRQIVRSYLQKDIRSGRPGEPAAPAMEQVDEEDRKELEQAIKRELK